MKCAISPPLLPMHTDCCSYNWMELMPVEQDVAGSSPAVGILDFIMSHPEFRIDPIATRLVEMLGSCSIHHPSQMSS